MPVLKSFRARVSTTGSIAILIAVVGWSFSNTIVKVSELPALTFAFWRLWLAWPPF